MLNELKDLSRSLKEAGIVQQDWHPFFDTCVKSARELPKGQNSNTKRTRKASGYLTYKIFLGKEGRITDFVGISPDEDISDTRKWKQNNNNGFSFPAFNISSLLKLNNSEAMKVILSFKRAKANDEIDWAAEIAKVINESSTTWTDAEYNRINRCLSEVPDDILNQLGEVPDQYKSIVQLCHRAKMLSAETLHNDLKTLIIQNIKNGQRDSGLMDLLFSAEGNKKIQLICDLNDWREVAEYPPNNKTTQSWMNNRFISYSELTRKTKPGPHSTKDAFNEDPSGANEKFPSVKLPVLDKVILRSMFKDKPCQRRYGMIESESFLVGDKAKKEMKRALDWLGGYGGKERKDKTWCNITGKVDKASLLFAYPTKKPDMAPELAGLMGGEEGNANDPDGTSFSAIAARVTQTLRGIQLETSDNEVRIFVLAKMDKARTKVVVSRRFTADHTIKSAKQWQEGCSNIPNIKIKQFENGTPTWKDCSVPFPAEVVWCLNTVWKGRGTYAERVHGFSMNDALSLLLDYGEESRSMDAIIRNCSSHLLAIGQATASGKVFEMPRKYIKYTKQSLLLPSILGILLYKLEHMKGGYMSSPAFLVGRIMNFADKLHLKYCEEERKSVPSQLIGNALMPTALDEPVKALSIMSQRILPYQSWANRLQGDMEYVGLVKYFLAQIGQLCDTLQGLDLPDQCSDVDKAQMLLGYLAWSEKKEN